MSVGREDAQSAPPPRHPVPGAHPAPRLMATRIWKLLPPRLGSTSPLPRSGCGLPGGPWESGVQPPAWEQACPEDNGHHGGFWTVPGPEWCFRKETLWLPRGGEMERSGWVRHGRPCSGWPWLQAPCVGGQRRAAWWGQVRLETRRSVAACQEGG